MKYVGLTVNLKDDPKLKAEYIEHHCHVWPEVEASLKRVGIAKTRIFLLGRRMFMYMEVADDFDPSTYIQRYLEEPKAVEWEALMAPYMEVLPEARPGELWAKMEVIYTLN